MRMILKSLHIENFKGVKDKTYEFGKITRVSGMNRRGKTTIGSAWYWLISDKNYELTSNPNIKPDNVEDCIPTVTADVDVDGKEITLSKMQKRKVGKPDKNGVSKVTITNTYEINSVPKTERDFKAYLEELGFEFDKFLICSHPNVFTKDLSLKKKQDEMRKYLFTMASEKTDLEIAQMDKETADVAKLLESYKFEEIEAMNNASKKKAVEQLDAIPNQIIGLEKAKVDVDVAEQELAKADLTRRIAECDKKIAGADHSLDELRDKEMRLQLDISGITQTMNRELSNRRYEIDADLCGCEDELKHLEQTISLKENQIVGNEKAITDADAERKKIGEKYNAEYAKAFDEAPYLFDESKWVFDENSTVCSLCGQKLPEDKIEQLKADFESQKEKAKADAEEKLKAKRFKFDTDKKVELNRLNTIGTEKKELITELTKKNADLNTEIDALKKQEQDAIAKKEELSNQLSEIPSEADYTQNEDYVKLKAERDKVLADIEKLESDGADKIVTDLKVEKADLQSQLDEVNKIIAQAENNVQIDDKIADMQHKQNEYGQAKADAERILYQLKEVSKRKNKLLVEEINQHFGIVRWKLFDFQKNGEYKEVCIPTVLDEETGIYKVFGDTTNTGREIEAKIDICNSFQKFFNMYVPIFLDGAESINDEYVPVVDTQLILLTVSEDKQLKVEGV
jgi:chromosome segregation ATPase|nr:MAG TPA: chromosome partition protein [Caudoviricetes sp.]